MLDFDFGYQLSLEATQPDLALEHALLVEKAGFDSIWASDHFMPWYHTNASAGFAWSWLGAAGQATKGLRIGTSITCPILRYHPALVAQAFATLERMFKGRVFISVATGEALNESPLGYHWPSHRERAKRLEEAIKIITRLWTGKFVTFKGEYFAVHNAKLYTFPTSKIPIFVASNGPRVAEIAGELGDGFLTIPAPEEHYKKILFPALRRGLEKAGKDFNNIDKAMELSMSYDKDYDRALKSVRPWAGGMMPVFYKYDIPDPREIEFHGNLVGDEQLSQAFTIGTSAEPFIKAIEKYARLGFNCIHVQNTSPSQPDFIRLFGEEVIPYVKEHLEHFRGSK